jgi:hypothetical protein
MTSRSWWPVEKSWPMTTTRGVVSSAQAGPGGESQARTASNARARVVGALAAYDPNDSRNLALAARAPTPLVGSRLKRLLRCSNQLILLRGSSPRFLQPPASIWLMIPINLLVYVFDCLTPTVRGGVGFEIASKSRWSIDSMPTHKLGLNRMLPSARRTFVSIETNNPRWAELAA